MLRAAGAVFAALLLVQSPPPRDALPSSASGTGTIRGRVVADDTDQPLRNARVSFESTSATSVLSDQQGRFALPAVPSTAPTIAVSKTGYAAVRAKIDGDDVEVRLPRGGVMTGRLLDAFGSPVPLFTIAAMRVSRVGGRVGFVMQAHVETDDAGAFRLFGLPAGDFIIGVAGGRTFTGASTPSLPRDITTMHRYYPNAVSPDTATAISVASGQEVAGIDMTMPVPPVPAVPARSASTRTNTASVAGRIVRADGTPVRRSHVELASAHNLFSPYVTIADDEGRYEFRGLAAGTYQLMATDLNFVVGFVGQREGKFAETIDVAAGAAIEHLDLVMPRSGSVGGRIVDEYGDPFENVNVRVEQIRPANGRMRLMRVPGVTGRQTDDLGRYRVAGLPPGRYLVEAMVGETVAGWVTNDLPGYGRTYYPGTLSVAAAQPVDLAAGDDVLTLDFAIARGGLGRIAGLVLDARAQAFSGAVYLMPSARSRAIMDDGFPKRVRTSDGRFAFDRLPPGEYVVQASTSPRDRAIEGSFGIEFVSIGASDATEVVVRMSSGSTIAGRLTFDGNPPDSPEGFEVSTRTADADFTSFADNAPARAEPDADWRFELSGLNGPRRLVVHAPAGWTMKAVLSNGIDVMTTPIPCGRNDDSVSGLEIVMARDRRP